MTLEIITSDALDTRHGFFTRKGGASAGIFSGLNCGLGSSDQNDVVQMNRHMVASYLDIEDDRLATLYQIHSPQVITVDTPPLGERPQADAMVTATKGIALGILTADCAPILFYDRASQTIGAAHAGWKGALHGVIGAVIDAMLALGANRQTIHATVGPCISQKSYEVGQEFLETFLAEDRRFGDFFAQGKDTRYQFDLPRFCLHQLRAEEIGQANWSGHCTYTDDARFFSYRRATHKGEPDYGRQISAIVL